MALNVAVSYMSPVYPGLKETKSLTAFLLVLVKSTFHKFSQQ